MMLRSLALLPLAIVGCGARSELDETVPCFENACDRPRAETCERLAPDATVLAVSIGGWPDYRLEAGVLYVLSDARIYRLVLAESADAEPLTAATSPVDRFDVHDGTVVWVSGTTVRTMPASGGADRLVASISEGALGVVIAKGRAVVAYAAAPDHTGNVDSVPLTGGAPITIGTVGLYEMRRDERTNNVLFGTGQGLIEMDPLTGAATDLLKGSFPDAAGDTGAATSVASSEDAVAVESRSAHPQPGTAQSGLWLLQRDAKPVDVLDGGFAAVAVDEADVIFDGIPGSPENQQGKIGLVARSGGQPVFLADSDSHFYSSTTFSTLAPNQITSDGTWVYWPVHCLDRMEDRIVRMAKP